MRTRAGGLRRSAALAVLLAGVAGASERTLTYTYTTDVLNPGDVELEPWTTVRLGKDQFFYRLDQRLELEAGVAEGFQVALYLNASSKLFDTGVGAERVRTNQFTWDGLSLEAKWKLMDSSADAFGLALYFEPTLASDEAELELKVLLDKRLDRLLFAANLVGEYEWGFGDVVLERELKLEVDLGASYQLTSSFAVGLEARSANVVPAGEGLTHATIFAGPVLSWRSKAVWAAASVMPQLVALTGPSPDLDEFERFQARLLVGFHL